MKKVLLTAVAIFGFGFANAQEVKFGIKAGVNMATLTGDSTEGLDSKFGFNVGGFAEIKISDKFSVQPCFQRKEQKEIMEVLSSATLMFLY